ncbi:MAG: FHA domain-containing protein [Planctomycetales bacterium]|nr:FHA domain-containing protein [Planctomycetales bacterium]
MGAITLRVLDGADRGRVFDDLNPPITIGREEGNAIQLNDDRVSRFHVKIQEDNDQLVLTDLESTNGTRVNGEDINIRILKYGDLITVGRSVLVFGSRDEIADRLQTLRDSEAGIINQLDSDEADRVANASSLDFEIGWSDNEDIQATLHILRPPDLPTRLTPGQAAQISEIIEYLHIRVRRLLESATESNNGKVTIDQRQWQALIDLQALLSTYMRKIGDPDS